MRQCTRRDIDTFLICFGARRSGSGSIQLRRRDHHDQPSSAGGQAPLKSPPRWLSRPAQPPFLFLFFFSFVVIHLAALSAQLTLQRIRPLPGVNPWDMDHIHPSRVEESKSPGSRVACCLGSLKCQRRGGQQGGQHNV